MKLNKLEEFCLNRDIGFSIGWNKNNDWFVEINNKYGQTFSIYINGHLSKKGASHIALKKLKQKLNIEKENK